MKYIEINKIYSSKVAEYLAKGYTINSSTMAGSQGEIAKIDLIKDDDFLRIYIDRESTSSWSDPTKWHGDVIVIRVGRLVGEQKEYFRNYIDSTVWTNKLETVEESIFYRISRHDDWYITDLNEAVAIQNKRYSRYHYNNTSSDYLTSDAAKNIARKYLMNKQGYQRIRQNELMLQRKSSRGERDRYYVIYMNNTYRLV